ncbi:glycosyltransferase family 2 protein [Metabacillus elymi]|uniref:Glycosyltransferase n=1 Tax=Metabacillus elymi TaxID=2745198 RepID=A0ABX6S5C9_9BACI|nr:glycosyltransferase [Metabacillus sp. KUDC1714]QNF28463.1 glycosyltransferase [Metabacillus sp. KUDC1714]
MKSQPSISIIFPVKNEGENVRSTLESLFSIETNYAFETIVVDDGSTDGCCNFLETYQNKARVKLVQTKGIGAANARNLGAAKASGEYLIFCDAHLQFENWWIDRLLEPLVSGKSDAVTPGIADMENPQAIGYGQTLSPKLETGWNLKQNNLFETAVLPGGCFVISRKVFNDVGGFEIGFKTWGHEDVELSIKLWLFGYRCHVLPDVTILHLFRRIHPYKVRSDDVYYNLIRMAFSHFNDVRIQKCKMFITNSKAKIIESQVLQDGVIKQRESYFQKRKYNDDWYFKKFHIDF